MSAPNEKSVLPSGTVDLEFRGMKLHGYCVEIADDFQYRIALHEFDRRPGGKTENMELAPVQYRVTLVWITDKIRDGFADALKFKKLLIENASGLFVHPIHGERQMTCSGWQNAIIRSGEPNTYTMPVTFVDNTIDTVLVGNQTKGIAAFVADIAKAGAGVVSIFKTITGS